MPSRSIVVFATGMMLALPMAAQQRETVAPLETLKQPTQVLGSPARSDSLSALLAAMARDPFGVSITSPSSVTRGARIVGAAERIQHDVASYRGDLTLRGAVEGNVIAIDGNVILEPGSSVSGDVVSVGGFVRQNGGRVGGEIREMSRVAVPGGMAVAATVTPVQATRRALAMVGAWLLVLTALATGVFLFARSNLETIADTIREDFQRSLIVGIAAELALLPAFVVLMVGLAITLIGILLIPFAAVAYFTAAAGSLALAFTAFAYVTGHSVIHRWRGNSGASGLVLLVTGLLFFFFLWLLAALFAWAGALSPALRAVASLITWLAVTAGLGATIVSRGGTRKLASPSGELPAMDEYSWQTPTPVSGVVAARRPTPASTRLNPP